MPVKVLIVEDEYLVALAAQTDLEQAGYVVAAVAATVEAALRDVDDHDIDVALLDVNLRGQHIRPVAQYLRDRGVPTGYASVLTPDDGVDDASVLSKPYSSEELVYAFRSTIQASC